MKNDTVYLEDILNAIRHIEQYTKKGKRSFMSHEVVQDAVIRQLAIIGEAVKHLPDSTRKQQPDISWKRIAGMRDILVHDYSKTDVGKVWETIRKDLPPLKKAVRVLMGA